MKVNQIEPERPFKPICITLESQEDVDKVYAILDHSSIVRAFNIENWYKQLRPFRTGAYTKYHSKLMSMLRDVK